MFLVTILTSPKPPEKISQLFKKGVASDKLLSLFKVYVKIFEKIAI